MTVTVRALAANGRLLRKAIGVAVPGGGLAPLWVDVRHVRTVQITVEGATTDSSVVVTAVGILPGSLPPYSIPNRTLSGGAPGANVAIDPEAFVSGCNSSVGLQDTSVGQQPVFGGTLSRRLAAGRQASSSAARLPSAPSTPCSAPRTTRRPGAAPGRRRPRWWSRIRTTTCCVG
jgi:hypothetical protein